MLNGFFAFAVYDKEKKSLFIARDRFGIKPLLYYFDGEKFIFSSELKAILQFKINKSVDKLSLFNYLQFNYIPSNSCMLEQVSKLAPGHFIFIKNIDRIKEVQEIEYYCIPYTEKETIQKSALNYDKSKEKLYELLHDAVEKRLVADVPVGTFLSGE